MSARHTPGPWSVYSRDELVLVNDAGSSIGEMVAGDPFIPYGQQRANALLAAAAPELLAVLAVLVDAMPVNGGMVRFDGDELAAARAAIAKARGAA